MSSGTFVKVMNDDKIYLVFTETTNEIIEDYVELEDKRDTHPWTCLRLGSSQIDGENIDYVDDELVEEYGEHWLILNDNPFAYNQEKKEQLITAIFNQIKEFGYSAFTSKTSFKPYLTCGDVVQFRNRDGNLVNSIILRYDHSFEDIILSAPSETTATINYVYPLSAIQMAKNTQIEVNKESNTITSMAETIDNLSQLVDSQGESIDTLGTRVTQNVESITASVTALQDEINNGVGKVKTTSVTIDNNGLNVSTDTSTISTTMTNDTFQIQSGDTTLAYFGYDNEVQETVAKMDNLTVDNYFTAGYHRQEKFDIDGEQRTGWFYVGGGN